MRSLLDESGLRFFFRMTQNQSKEHLLIVFSRHQIDTSNPHFFSENHTSKKENIRGDLSQKGGKATKSLGYLGSNQKRQDQNLPCYHYTIAQWFVFVNAKIQKK